MFSNVVGASGAALAIATIVLLETRYPCTIQLTRDGRPAHERDFTSKHGACRADPHERMMFSHGLTFAALQYLVFAGHGLAVATSLIEVLLLGGAAIAAAALIFIAQCPHDSGSRIVQCVHAIAAATFFLGSMVMATGFAVVLPVPGDTVVRVLLLVFMPIALILARDAAGGLRAGIGIDIFIKSSPLNSRLREVETLAAVLLGLIWLAVAIFWQR